MTDLAGVASGSGIAGVATGLGALPVFVRDRVTHGVYDTPLGIAPD